MDDPRLDETHLDPPRLKHYQLARDEVFESMGPVTGDVEQAFHARGLSFGFVPGPARYALRDMRSGRLHLLRVGINTIGRHPDNDIVLPENPVSRRHCVILVHATGGCEVRDTASRNGVRFGHQPVPHADLAPGDVLRVCNYQFMFLAESKGESAGAESRTYETGDRGAARTD